MNDELSRQIIDKLNSMDKRLEGIENHLNRHDKKFDTIMEQVVKNSEDITLIKEGQRALIVGQQKQDKILESLAMRSLEQESDIRDLKRIK